MLADEGPRRIWAAPVIAARAYRDCGSVRHR
jgi:hypothetical protein